MEEETLSKKELKKKKKEEKKRQKLEKKEEKKTNTKKKVHLKNKKVVIPVLLLVIILLTIGGYFGYQKIQKDTVRTIKKNYNRYVILKKDTKLYNKNKKVVGSIKKDFILELEDIKKITLKNTHLKIKDYDYYIYYKDIKKTTVPEKDLIETYYLPLDKTLSATKEVSFYQGKKKVITLNKGMNDILIEKKEKDSYYVSFLGKDLKVKKTKDMKEKDIKSKNETKKAEYVSIIYYDKVLDNCGEDTTCLRPASLKAHIKRLQKEGYYFITKQDIIDYVNGYINVKEKAVYIAVGNENDITNQISKELNIDIAKIEEKDGIKLVVTNKKTTPNDTKENINCYQAKSYTIIDKYVDMANGLDITDNGKETSNNQGIAVLNYHFFYDQTIPGESAACNESICLEREKLKSHLEWLKNNGYKTLTIEEFADWMDGIIEIPDKSVLLTIDDGAHGTGAHNGNVLIPLLEEYQEHATLFLIAGWWDINNYKSDYLDIQSHSFNLHYEASCPDGRGMVACSDYATVKKDLQQSLDVIKDNTSFCFPFYSYDNESLQAIKELGFRVSFVGGSVKARRTNNHYLIPRYPIMDDISLNEFIWMVS